MGLFHPVARQDSQVFEVDLLVAGFGIDVAGQITGLKPLAGQDDQVGQIDLAGVVQVAGYGGGNLPDDRIEGGGSIVRACAAAAEDPDQIATIGLRVHFRVHNAGAVHFQRQRVSGPIPGITDGISSALGEGADDIVILITDLAGSGILPEGHPGFPSPAIVHAERAEDAIVDIGIAVGNANQAGDGDFPRRSQIDGIIATGTACPRDTERLRAGDGRLVADDGRGVGLDDPARSYQNRGKLSSFCD